MYVVDQILYFILRNFVPIFLKRNKDKIKLLSAFYFLIIYIFLQLRDKII
jgi:hypothetical protein